MRAAWPVVFGLAACNAVYGIERTDLEPPTDPDPDRDEVANPSDNCPTTVNPSQSDDDGDGVGDACDNCPLVSNAAQVDTDDDHTGDPCDSHPTAAGDCLVFYDSFSDAVAFATRWRIETDDPAPGVTAENGHVVIRAAPMTTVMLVSVDATGARFDVHAAFDASLLTNTSSVAVASNITAADAGYFCTTVGDIATEPTVLARALGPPPDQGTTGGRFTSRALGTRLVARLISNSITASPQLRCRVDYGIALGVATFLTPPAQLTAGAAGVVVSGDTVTLHGIAVYRYDPGATCGTGEVR